MNHDIISKTKVIPISLKVPLVPITALYFGIIIYILYR